MGFFRIGAVSLATALLVASISSFAQAPQQAKGPSRAALWVDALRGEPIGLDEMLQDLQQARVIYLGEYHTIPRQHELELKVLEALAGRGVPLVLAMEQFESPAQVTLNRFNAGSLDLRGLVEESGFGRTWPGYTNYTRILSAAAQRHIPVLALNAPAGIIRAVARQGLGGLTADQRRELPAILVTDDPIYERFLNKALAVHMAFDPEKLRPVYEAQVARDETMATRLTDYLKSTVGRDRVALVICGRGHCEFGLGMPSRVERRAPGLIQRILLLSESGDLVLSEAESKQSRPVEIPHQFLKELGRAPADYFHIIEEAR